MLPRLSQRTYDLMRRAIDAVDRDTADLITTMVASAFVEPHEWGVSSDLQATEPCLQSARVVAGVKPREAVVRLRRSSATSGQLVSP